MVLEAALAATPPEQRAALYQPVLAAVEQAFQQCFPQVERSDHAQNRKFPATPLADDVAYQLLQQAAVASPSSAAESVMQLSPEIAEATLHDTKPNDATTAKSAPSIALRQTSIAQLSPKIQQATATDLAPTDETSPNEMIIAAEPASAGYEQSSSWQSSPRIEQFRQQDAVRRKKARQTTKREKAAKKRAAASRRRNAA